MPSAYQDARFSGARSTGETERDHWRTPRPLFDRLNREFQFDYDVAADETNHLVHAWFGPSHPNPEYRDALRPTAVWGKSSWCNPPYSLADRFLVAATGQVNHHHVTVAMLVFARTAEAWWWRYVLGRKPANASKGGRAIGSRYDGVLCAAEIRWCPGRINFVAPDGLETDGNSSPAPSCLVVFRPAYYEMWPGNGILLRD